MFRNHPFRIAAATLASIGALAIPVASLAASAYLTGTVIFKGTPVAGATVTATGNNIVQSTRTGTDGRFSFAALSPGSYVLVASSDSGNGTLVVDLPANGTNVTLEVGIKSIGRVTASAVRRPPIRGSGTDLVLNSVSLSRTPASGSFPEMLIQLPGAARGANGAVHLNGDHGDINYIVDGVSIPQELNRVVGSEFNPGDAAFVDVLQGAYPAQYGERFATILNISTRTDIGTAKPGATVEVDGGSFATYDATFGYHDRVGSGNVVMALQEGSTGRGLDPPQPLSLHNNASNANQFLRYTLPYGANRDSFMNLTLSHSYR